MRQKNAQENNERYIKNEEIRLEAREGKKEHYLNVKCTIETKNFFLCKSFTDDIDDRV